MRAFEHAADVGDDPDRVVRRFDDTPLRWLPLVAGLHGTSEFDGRIRILGVPARARFSVGGPWEDEGTTGRQMDLAIGGFPPGVHPLAQLHGELSLSPEHDRARVRYRGSGHAPGRGPRHLLGHLMIPAFARATVRAVAQRLGAHG